MSYSWVAPYSLSWLELCCSWPTTALEHTCWCAFAHPVLFCLCSPVLDCFELAQHADPISYKILHALMAQTCCAIPIYQCRLQQGTACIVTQTVLSHPNMPVLFGVRYCRHC